MSLRALRRAVKAFDLAEHAERLDDRERDASFGLLAMVVGAGNFGKSSLVNAICGREVAPVSIVPKTFKIDVFTAGRFETALVRRVGQTRPVECTQGEARHIESEAERAKSGEGTAPLAEIVWRYDDLILPQGISLVDTPGISQALQGAAKGVSLTKVLGSTFEVDEVWARWFHRADVVLWAFCANKMEDADTRLALESALDLFDKPIIPVATKADLVARDRWPEIAQRFNRIYRTLLKGRQASDLHLTVTGGPDPSLIGTGIPGLRASLTEIAANSKAIKSLAEAAFIRDESWLVAQVLEETAKTMVSNLRAIATLGDTLAIEAVKEAERGRQEAYSRVNSYLGSFRTDPRLDAAAKAVHEATVGGRIGDIEAEARAQLTALVDEKEIARRVNDAYVMSARSLEAIAERVSQGAEVARLSFSSSGRISRVPVHLRLKLRALAVTSKLKFSIKLTYPAGFFATAWDRIKGIFGIERFSVSHIHAAMTSALDIPVEDFEPSMDQALYDGFAPALRLAVESALKEHLSSMDSRALQQLKQVDVHLPELDPHRDTARVSTYGPQGEYWATLDPAVETLLNMAREELTQVLPEFKSLMTEPFAFEGPHEFPSFNRIWRNRTVGSKSVKVEGLLRDIARQAQYSETYDREGSERTRSAPFTPYVQKLHAKFLETAPMIEALDENLANSVGVARYRSAGTRLAQIGSKAFVAAFEQSARTWTASVPHERFLRQSLGRGTLAGTFLVLLIAVGLLFVRLEFALVASAAAIGWFGIGLFRPYVTLLNRYERGIATAVRAEVRSCQQDSAGRLPATTVRQVMRGMTAELAPRPLQKLLIAAGDHTVRTAGP